MALRFDRQTLTKLGPWVPAAVLVALALFIAWAFVATTLAYTRRMGLPLDDSYIYLTYAKQFGRAQPFTYFPGGGYSAGATSILWPMLLAPFWTLGARGHALVWVAYGLCAALYAAVGVGVYRFARVVSGRTDHAGGVAAAAMALSIAPFAWCALSGMEVALAAALLIGSLLLLAREPHEGRPSTLLLVCLAATSLARPEMLLLVGTIVAVKVISRLRRRAWRQAGWWLLPLAPAALWLLANRVFAGHFVPNTAIVKGYFYQPGFTWPFWREAVVDGTRKLVLALFADPKTPLVWPSLVVVLFVAGSVRVVLWARRERRMLVGIVVIAAPIVLMLAVIATSGLYAFQNYRYIAAALPLLFLPVGVALLPIRRVVSHVWARRAWQLLAVALAVGFVLAGRTRLVADMKLYAQEVVDTNTQVVALGDYIHRKLPDARVMFHDAGAIAYYGDGEVIDLLGLVTNDIADVALNGPGSRFEYLESLPPDERPTHFAYYPSWMGTSELFGADLVHTRVGRTIEPRRLTGDVDMQLFAADWDHVHTAERPINDHQGWDVVDRIDVADLASERAHGWRGRLGVRHMGDVTAKWSFVDRSTSGPLYIDGGRTIRAGGEHFRVTLDPLKPTRLVLRTGGSRNFKHDDLIARPVDITIYTDRRKLASLTVAPPSGAFSELAFNLPPQATQSRTLDITVDASGPYRVFHWFVLQPSEQHAAQPLAQPALQ
jgi:hypothetical protein